jgi:hypothetical protein
VALPLNPSGAVTLTTDTTGATWAAGFLRRPSDGALVATAAPSAPSPRSGFSRDTNGALVIEDGSTPVTGRGLHARTAAGALPITQVDPNLQYATGPNDGNDDIRRSGVKQDAAGRLYAVVVA